jgi:hypothetical protein
MVFTKKAKGQAAEKTNCVRGCWCECCPKKGNLKITLVDVTVAVTAVTAPVEAVVAFMDVAVPVAVVDVGIVSEDAANYEGRFALQKLLVGSQSPTKNSASDKAAGDVAADAAADVEAAGSTMYILWAVAAVEESQKEAPTGKFRALENVAMGVASAPSLESPALVDAGVVDMTVADAAADTEAARSLTYVGGAIAAADAGNVADDTQTFAAHIGGRALYVEKQCVSPFTFDDSDDNDDDDYIKEKVRRARARLTKVPKGLELPGTSVASTSILMFTVPPPDPGIFEENGKVLQKEEYVALVDAGVVDVTVADRVA